MLLNNIIGFLHGSLFKKNKEKIESSIVKIDNKIKELNPDGDEILNMQEVNEKIMSIMLEMMNDHRVLRNRCQKYPTTSEVTAELAEMKKSDLSVSELLNQIKDRVAAGEARLGELRFYKRKSIELASKVEKYQAIRNLIVKKDELLLEVSMLKSKHGD